VTRVSIVMSVFNGARYLGDAIDSLLNQTFRDFEIIIVNDASTDDSERIIQKYDDRRIRCIHNDNNIGLTRSLNRGLSIAVGEYVARMDADDISLPERLAAQVAFLDSHADVGVLGTGFQLIDESGCKGESIVFPGDHGFLKWKMCFFFNPIAHPSVMVRRNLMNVAGNYDEQLSTSQDYDLWARLSSLTRLSILPQILLYLRKHELSVSSQQFKQQKKQSFLISQRLISQIIQREIPDYRIRDIWKSVWALGEMSYKEVRRCSGIIYRLCLANLADPSLSQNEKLLVFKDAIERLQSMAKDKNRVWLWNTFFYLYLFKRAIH
jgi:glycosyltransferase involved in cell wall biosynthesis